MFSLIDIYNIAIQIERNGEKDYLEAANAASDEKMKKLYIELARQEAEHAASFAKMAESPEQREKKFEDEQLQKLSKDILQKMVKDSSFLREEHDFTAIDTSENALEAALEIENDSITFYQFLLDLVEDEDIQRKIEHIIAEERNHIKILEELR